VSLQRLEAGSSAEEMALMNKLARLSAALRAQG